MQQDLFWKSKIVQFFHDPPGKPYAFFPGAGGHRQLAQRLFQAFTMQMFHYYPPRPDRAASGADRPVLSLPRGKSGGLGTLGFHNDPLATHPLTLCPLRLHHTDDKTIEIRKEILEEQNDQEEDARALARIVQADWGTPETLQRGYVVLWRRYREELMNHHGSWEKGDLLWEHMPADSRCPDHSIWEHMRVTTALAFLDTPKRARVPETREPWLFTLSLTPVQQFITESRTSRDLWLSSFLLADLAWYAMLPVVELYGPDCIMYPDLRGNPRVDVWLARTYPDALPPYLDNNPSTFAATLPHTFTAIVPRGGEGYLVSLEDLASRCQTRVQTRWQELTGVVHSWLVRQLPSLGLTGTHWQTLWEQQQRDVFQVAWNAVRWRIPERLDDFRISGAFPGQDHAQLPPVSPADVQARLERSQRLAPWIPTKIWSHYEWVREVFGLTHPEYLQEERGFDYALTHHQLRQRHSIRKQAKHVAVRQSASGEKCTLCHRREALWEPQIRVEGAGAPPEQQRQRVRLFWSMLDKDGRGAERLCAVCTTKRFLVEADRDATQVNFIWAGPSTPLQSIRDLDGNIRVPFPSTAAIAAQEYLRAVTTHPELQEALQAVITAYRQAALSETAFARALPRLAEAANQSSTAEQFLRLDTQLVAFPHIIQAEIEACKVTAAFKEKEQLQQLLKPVQELARRITQLRQTSAPAFPEAATRFAVLKLDGDHMSRLLLGDPAMIQAHWRDVIHPKVVENLSQRQPFLDAGWQDLLAAKRLVGPSLHAFISRALADFAHQIVPWVIEREFGGRLIYSGGDDVLALAPADDALPIAARLQQLFSAPWVIDTHYTADPWDWRRPGWRESFPREQARQRFALPLRTGDLIDLRSDTTTYAPHVIPQEPWHRGKVEGRVLGLLGPGASLSAAIVYAHFKTPLTVLLSYAHTLLNDEAKRKAGRSAVALSHFSRNGVKSVVTMHWRPPEEETQSWRGVTAHGAMKQIQEAFMAKNRRSGGAGDRLPNRLPYKLREVAYLADAARINKQLDNTVLEGLLRRSLERPIHDALRQAVLHVWRAGFATHPEAPERSVDGLLLCRALSRATEEDDV